MRTTRTTSSSTAARSFPPPTHPGDGLAPPRSHYNHRAALVAWVVRRLRGGARAGSAGKRGREIAFRSDLEDFGSFCGASTFEPCVWRSRSRSVLPSSGVTRWRPARPKSSAGSRSEMYGL
jgi:hypothetical protein